MLSVHPVRYHDKRPDFVVFVGHGHVGLVADGQVRDCPCSTSGDSPRGTSAGRGDEDLRLAP